MNIGRTSLLGSTATLAICIASAGGAAAQPASPAEAHFGGVEEIVVTARRVNENLQEVPTSVGVVSAAELENRQIQSVSDLRQAVANLTVQKTPVAGGNIMTIRGVTGQAIPNVSVDSSIGIYIDGVYLGRPQASGTAIADIARVEVLRGPQGTLFGRNSSGGAINFVTGSPGETFGASASALYGNYDQKRASLTVDSGRIGPFMARFSYFHEDYAGDIRNTSGGRSFAFNRGVGSFTNASRLGGRNSDAFMAKVLFDGLEGFTAEYKFDWLDQQEISPQGQIMGFGPGQFGQALAGVYLAQAPGNVILSDERQSLLNLDFTGEGSVRSYGHLLTLTQELGANTTIKSISAYRHVSTRSTQDSDGGAYRVPATTIALAASGSINEQRQRQITQELQVIGKYDRFDYIVGGYFFQENGNSDLYRFSFKPLIPGADGLIPVVAADLFTGQLERARNTSYAAYAHAGYRITDQLEIAGGGRYTEDKRRSRDERTATPVASAVNFDRFNYDVSLTYSPTDDVHIYGRYATGYQSGGVIRQVQFSPEDSKSIELGLKSEWFDRRLRFNAAIFHQKVTDQQVAGFDPLVGLVVRNVGQVKIDGAEIEATAVPIDRLTLSANYGLANAKASTGEDARSPKHTFSFSGEYQTETFGDGMFVSFRLDGDYRSKYTGIGATLLSSRQANPAFPLPPAIYRGFASEQAYLDDLFRRARAGGYWQLNARVTLNDVSVGRANFRVAAFVRNLTDNAGRLYAVNTGAIAAIYERPRSYGLEVAAAF